MKLIITDGFEPIADTNSQTNDEAITNYINSIHPDVSYLPASNAKTTADTQPTASSTIAHALSYGGSDYYGVSLQTDDNDPAIIINNEAVANGFLSPPPYSTLRDGIELSFATNLFAANANPVQFKINLTASGVFPFQRVINLGFGTAGWIANDGSPLALSGANVAVMPTDGSWHKIYVRVWKSGSDLKISMATSVDANDVVTYTENIGSEEIIAISFASSFGTGNVDDITVYEVEPADISSIDTNFGLFDFQKHIKMYMVRGGNKELNGTSDTWVPSATNNFDDVTDGDLGTNAVATSDELGIEQTISFATVASQDGLSNADLKSLGYIAVLKDDGGQFGLRTQNGGNQIDDLVPTPSSVFGVIRSQAIEGDANFTTLGANAGTNGMKFTARKTI